MELEEMQKAWAEMSAKLGKQEKLTDKLIMDMTAQKYKSRLRSLTIPETIGSVLSLVGSGWILWNFNTYDSLYLQVSAALSAIILIVLPALSMRALYGMRALKIGEDNYRQILDGHVKNRRRFINSQKMGMYLGFILLVVMLPVTLKLMGGKVTHMPARTWFWYLPTAFVFFFLFTRFVYRCYHRTTVYLDNLVKELED